MKCSFCNGESTRGTGKYFVRKSGKVLFFCSTKCERNMLKLGRVGREQKWTEAQ
ncbi:MAG: 50S ribosomal protein L24e [Nanoarchaeota archaeon]|nr:MAG: 50S ribosomal protein L24e [Nanoarchaeota archaeon]